MKINWQNQTYYGLVILVVLSRLLPHPPNFTPIGALGLYTGAYADHKGTWIIPIVALIISDLVIGLYEPVAMIMVYLGFIACMGLGKLFLSEKRGFLSVLSACFASALIFFIFSNFGVWLTGTLYPMTLAGLSACYIAAIPFFGNTLAGHIVYGAVMFGLFEYISRIMSNTRLPETA